MRHPEPNDPSKQRRPLDVEELRDRVETLKQAWQILHGRQLPVEHGADGK